MPDVVSLIKASIDVLGVENVSVIPLVHFDDGIKYLSDRFGILDLKYNDNENRGNLAEGARFYLNEGNHQLFGHNIFIPKNHLLHLNKGSANSSAVANITSQKFTKARADGVAQYRRQLWIQFSDHILENRLNTLTI